MIACAADEPKPQLTLEHYRVYRAIMGVVTGIAGAVQTAAIIKKNNLDKTSTERIIPGLVDIYHDTLLTSGPHVMRIVIYSTKKGYGVASFVNRLHTITSRPFIHRSFTYHGGDWTLQYAMTAYDGEINSILRQTCFDDRWTRDLGDFCLIRDQRFCWPSSYSYGNRGDCGQILSIVKRGEPYEVIAQASDERLGIDAGASYLCSPPIRLKNGRLGLPVENKYGETVNCSFEQFKFKFRFNFDEVIGEKR